VAEAAVPSRPSNAQPGDGLGNDVEIESSGIGPGGSSAPSPAAVEVSRLFSGYRLQVARQARSLTKTELGKRLGISTAALSQFEKGHARPSAATVERLCAVLSFAPSFFSTATVLSSSPQADDERVDSFGHFRSLRSVTATKRRQVLTVAHLLRDVTAFLESRVLLPEQSIPHHYAGSPELAAKVAVVVREQLGIDHDGPIDDVLRILERHGVVCARYPIEASDVSAFSVPMERRTFLVLKRQREAKRDRDRFSSCHELGHLVMHKPGQVLASKEIEREANAFASEFLMPATRIADELPSRADWPALLQLKQRWGTSMAALLLRARTLGVMSEATYVQAARTMSMRGWRVDEPGTVMAVEAPALLGRAMTAAALTAAEVGEATGWPESMVADLIADSSDGRPAVQL
jgi:Zn-dependent peptidase ImmA (M78 family)/transcriptional regulator with XRE-family HTH domain